MRNCNRCKGYGRTHVWYDTYEGPVAERCRRCAGAGTYPDLDVQAIVDGCFTKRGTRRFRRSLTSTQAFGDVQKARIYYVWRMARFHGGADVTMPMTAAWAIDGDPYIRELDLIADRIAKAVFGTDRAAAYRWGNLLGFVKANPPAGLPDSAYEGGPVHDGNKPGFERLEER